MPLVTLRFDDLYPDGVNDDGQWLADALSSFGNYYIQYEEGSKTGKMHWQGWIDASVTANHLGNKSSFGKLIRKRGYAKPLFAVTPLNKKDSYFRYILKNNTKSAADKWHSNYDVMVLNEIMKDLPVWEEKRPRKLKDKPKVPVSQEIFNPYQKEFDGMSPNRRAIAMWVKQWYMENKFTFNYYRYKDVVAFLIYRQFPDDESVIDKVLSDIV